MADFNHIDYSPELERIRGALTSIKDDFIVIKDDFIEIKDDFATIESDIGALKARGVSCSSGIYTTSTLNAYSRALALMSVRDENELADLIAELENPTIVPEA